MPATDTNSQVRRCTKTACYNQRNGMNCFTVTHTDGGTSFGWTELSDATDASYQTKETALRKNPARRYTTC